MCILNQLDGMTINQYTKRKSSYKCVICLNSFRNAVGYSTNDCQHMMCLTCAKNYFNSILKNSTKKSFDKVQCCSSNCPETYSCMEIIDEIFSNTEADDWWRTALLASCFKNKVTCPFNDCKAIYDTDGENMKKCTFGLCFECNRGFCIPCQSLWRPDRMVYHNEEEDVKKILTEAEKKNWCRCPKCSHMIEKTGGCSTVYCVCGIYFCYKCGGYSDNHNCINRCHELTVERVRQLRTPMFTNVKKTKTTSC